jgi:hypothetical protein
MQYLGPAYLRQPLNIQWKDFCMQVLECASVVFINFSGNKTRVQRHVSNIIKSCKMCPDWVACSPFRKSKQENHVKQKLSPEPSMALFHLKAEASSQATHNQMSILH